MPPLALSIQGLLHRPDHWLDKLFRCCCHRVCATCSTYKYINMAMTNDLFISHFKVARSVKSLLLATSFEFSDLAKYGSNRIFDASAKLPQATEGWERSEEMSHSAFNEAFATELPFPEYLAKNPSMGRVLRKLREGH
jgi:hypothetical protein